jgi:hypothetical protein
MTSVNNNKMTSVNNYTSSDTSISFTLRVMSKGQEVGSDWLSGAGHVNSCLKKIESAFLRFRNEVVL